MNNEPDPNNSPPSNEPSLVNNPPPDASPGGAPEWKEYVPDPSKSEEENAAAKVEHDKGKPAEPAPEAQPPLTAEDIPLPDNLPEGLEINEEARDRFLEIVNDQNLGPKERAEKLVALQTEVMTKASERISEAWTQTQTEWQNQVRADPDIGGDKLEPTLGAISKLIDEYGTPDLRQVFDLTGAGNHPQMVKFLSKVATALSEGKPIAGAPGAADDSEESKARRMFPSMKG